MADDEERRHYRICPLCEACCGLEVRTRGEGTIASDEEGYEEWAATEAAGHEHAEPALPAGARA